jgi:hypothetical protein
MGYIAKTLDTSSMSLRRAMIYGATMGSIAVQKFSVSAFDDVTPADVAARVRGFRELTHVVFPETLA